MSGKKKWIEVDRVLSPGVLYGVLFEQDGKDIEPSITPPARGRKVASRQELPTQKALEPEKPSVWPDTPRMKELEHPEPSLASRTRPDLGDPKKRQDDLSNQYNDPKTSSKYIEKSKKKSLNVTLKGELGSGKRYIAKPDSGILQRDKGGEGFDKDTLDAAVAEAPDASRRHDAVYEIASAMGAHHMVVPGIRSKIHDLGDSGPWSARAIKWLKSKIPGYDPNDPYSAKAHAGSDAHIQEFSPDSIDGNSVTKEDLKKVDLEHRVHGLVLHLLFGQQDGHVGNVLIHKKGHPIIIDHDMSLRSRQAIENQREHGAKTIRSAFAPGSQLDYQDKMPKDSQGNPIQFGTNFYPRMKEVLQRIAEGYYSKGNNKLNISDDDHEELQSNARQLLSYGIEGTLGRRVDLDDFHRKAKQEKQNRLDAINNQSGVEVIPGKASPGETFQARKLR